MIFICWVDNFHLPKTIRKFLCIYVFIYKFLRLENQILGLWNCAVDIWKRKLDILFNIFMIMVSPKSIILIQGHSCIKKTLLNEWISQMNPDSTQILYYYFPNHYSIVKSYTLITSQFSWRCLHADVVAPVKVCTFQKCFPETRMVTFSVYGVTLLSDFFCPNSTTWHRLALVCSVLSN